MGLIALITNSYLKGGGGADWRFCLLLSSILVDITNNSVYKGIIVSFEKRGQKWTGDVEPSAGYLVLFKWSIQHRLNIGYGSRKGKIQKIFCKSNSQCFFFSLKSLSKSLSNHYFYFRSSWSSPFYVSFLSWVRMSSTCRVFIAQMVESLNRANHQPSNGLKFNCHRQKGFFFYRQQSKRFKVLQIFIISTELHGLWTPGGNGKNHGPCSQKHSLNVTRPYNFLIVCVYLKILRNFICEP